MHILVVDDDPSFNEMVSKFLVREGFQVVPAYGGKEALKSLAKNSFDLVLADYRLPGMDGLELTEKIKETYPELPVILITNYADIRLAINSIKLGAFEFVSKPVIPDELLKIIKMALENPKAKSIKTEERQEESSDYIVGKNKQTKELWNHLSTIAPTKMNVLITGESGTGKEHLARTIHSQSRRADKPFVAVDCGALSLELAGSELFGHVKGAFTGANSDKKGLFEEADGGTLFLDEVGNLPYEIQVSLLRAIQEETIKKVGGNKEIKVDVRLVAATNDSLMEQVESNNFRNDLFHRLNEFELYVAPLRERMDDIDEFCRFFVAQACEEFGKPMLQMDEEVRDIFRNYYWPGNLRELKNIIKRAVILTSGEEINADVLPAGLKDISIDQTESIGENQIEIRPIGKLNIKDQNQEQEKRLIIEALEKYKYNKTKAAKVLNIDRSTLYKKMKHYEISF